MTAAVSMRAEKSRDIKISRWFSQYANRLLRFVRSRIRDIDEAEDLAQDVWYQLSRQNDVDEIEQIGAWLFTAARNRVINYYKKQKSVPFSALQPNDGEPGVEEDAPETDHLYFNRWIEAQLPDEILESAEFWTALNKALSQLPPEQRAVFTAHEFDEISFREMSEQSGVPLNTLLARKRYAVLFLRRFFEDWI